MELEKAFPGTGNALSDRLQVREACSPHHISIMETVNITITVITAWLHLPLLLFPLLPFDFLFQGTLINPHDAEGHILCI